MTDKNKKLPDFIPTIKIGGHDFIDIKNMSVDDWRKAMEFAIKQTYENVSNLENNIPDSKFLPLKWHEVFEVFTTINSMFYHVSSVNSNEDLQNLNEEMSVKVSEMLSKSLQSKIIAEAFGKAIEDNKNDKLLMRSCELSFKQFKNAGSTLSDEGKVKLLEIFKELALTESEFDKINLSNNTNTLSFSIDELEGVNESSLDSLNKDENGKYKIPVGTAYIEPMLAEVKNQATRKKMWEAWTGRGYGIVDGDVNTSLVISKIVSLRSSAAKLLGYETWAEMSLQNTMAKNKESAIDLLKNSWSSASRIATADLASIHSTAIKNGHLGPLNPWDVEFWKKKHIESQFSVDMDDIKKYFSLENVRRSSFETAKKLFGIEFKKSDEFVDEFSSLYSVSDNGKVIGHIIFDDYARPEKQSGAWMMSLREPNGRDSDTVVVVNVLNLPKPATGQPTLIEFSDAVTVFHEFGHALHGLLARSDLKPLAGIEVSRDFVEMPSQILENWIKSPEVLKQTAKHWRTGESLEQDKFDKMMQASSFGEAISTATIIQSALIDMCVHSECKKPNPDLNSIERAVIKELQPHDCLKPRHKLNHFSHLFGGGYSAGYYGYVWAEVLEADSFTRFSGDVFNQEAAKDLKLLFELGNEVEPETLIKNFLGRDLDPSAIQRKWGVVVEEKKNKIKP